MKRATGHRGPRVRRRFKAAENRRSTRRDVLGALATCAFALFFAPLMRRADAQSKVPRIGFLGATSAAGSASWVNALRAGLRDLGYVESKNVIIDYRWADGNYERLPELATELVRLRVNIIVASPTPAIEAARRVTTEVPIIMAATPDPVGAGFIRSLARPGGNVTGLSNLNVDLSSKYVELLRLAVPRLTRIALLANPSHQNHPLYTKNIGASASTFGITVDTVTVDRESNLQGAFASALRHRPNAMIVLPDPLFLTHGGRIATLATESRLPAMFWTAQLAEAGGLMSYGQDLVEHFRRAATYVDKIFKGAKAGDLPVEQPTKLELVVNNRTAKRIGLTLSSELLLRADRVID